MNKTQMKKPEPMSINQGVDFAVQSNANLSRDTIREWLYKDVKQTHLLIIEILNSKECIDALTDVLYARYTEMHNQMQQDNSQVPPNDQEVRND